MCAQMEFGPQFVDEETPVLIGSGHIASKPVFSPFSGIIAEVRIWGYARTREMLVEQMLSSFGSLPDRTHSGVSRKEMIAAHASADRYLMACLPLVSPTPCRPGCQGPLSVANPGKAFPLVVGCDGCNVTAVDCSRGGNHGIIKGSARWIRVPRSSLPFATNIQTLRAQTNSSADAASVRWEPPQLPNSVMAPLFGRSITAAAADSSITEQCFNNQPRLSLTRCCWFRASALRFASRGVRNGGGSRGGGAWLNEKASVQHGFVSNFTVSRGAEGWDPSPSKHPYFGTVHTAVTFVIQGPLIPPCVRKGVGDGACGIGGMSNIVYITFEWRSTPRLKDETGRISNDVTLQRDWEYCGCVCAQSQPVFRVRAWFVNADRRAVRLGQSKAFNWNPTKFVASISYDVREQKLSTRIGDKAVLVVDGVALGSLLGLTSNLQGVWLGLVAGFMWQCSCTALQRGAGSPGGRALSLSHKRYISEYAVHSWSFQSNWHPPDCSKHENKIASSEHVSNAEADLDAENETLEEVSESSLWFCAPEAKQCFDDNIRELQNVVELPRKVCALALIQHGGHMDSAMNFLLDQGSTSVDRLMFERIQLERTGPLSHTSVWQRRENSSWSQRAFARCETSLRAGQGWPSHDLPRVNMSELEVESQMLTKISKLLNSCLFETSSWGSIRFQTSVIVRGWLMKALLADENLSRNISGMLFPSQLSQTDGTVSQLFPPTDTGTKKGVKDISNTAAGANEMKPLNWCALNAQSWTLDGTCDQSENTGPAHIMLLFSSQMRKLSGTWSHKDTAISLNGVFQHPLKIYPAGWSGLVNLGNSCYLNSFLQCMFMTDQFRSALFSLPLPVSELGHHGRTRQGT